MAFYTRAFGATVLYESAMPGGSGIHAHLQIGKTMIMVTDERPPSPDGIMLGVAAPESLGATTTILEYYVDDVDAATQRATDAGAKPISRYVTRSTATGSAGRWTPSAISGHSAP